MKVWKLHCESDLHRRTDLEERLGRITMDHLIGETGALTIAAAGILRLPEHKRRDAFVFIVLAMERLETEIKQLLKASLDE